jgi:hypothetical protein
MYILKMLMVAVADGGLAPNEAQAVSRLHSHLNVDKLLL